MGRNQIDIIHSIYDKIKEKFSFFFDRICKYSIFIDYFKPFSNEGCGNLKEKDRGKKNPSAVSA